MTNAPPSVALKPGVPVPPAGSGVCPICHGPAGSSRKVRLCASCRRVANQLGRRLVPVVPIALCTAGTGPGEFGSDLYLMVRRAKWDLPDRQLVPLRKSLACLAGAFFARHAACIAAATGGPWDVTTHVPSSKGRPGIHPLLATVASSHLLPGRHHTLLRAGRQALSHTQAGAGGFEVTEGVSSRRVLLLDDAYASGSRAQSAAAVLEEAGATVTAILVFVRVVDPGFGSGGARFWAGCRTAEWDLERCCLEEGGPLLEAAA